MESLILDGFVRNKCFALRTIQTGRYVSILIFLQTDFSKKVFEEVSETFFPFLKGHGCFLSRFTR